MCFSEDQKVQKEASSYILSVNLAMTIPAVIMACILGSWSDKRGRKGPMVTASIGGALDAAIILVAIYLKLPVYVFMIGQYFFRLLFICPFWLAEENWFWPV